jgi:hypothetical protein
MDQYLRDEIFAPLGITDFTWTLDRAGNPHAMSGLQIRALDLARIGQMMLQGGEWKGKTIVPRSWVTQSTGAGQRFEPTCGLLWWRLGDFRRLAASDELIAAWREGGASEAFIRKILPLKDVVYASRARMRAALQRVIIWTVVTPPSPPGVNELRLPELPEDLISVWAGGQAFEPLAITADTPASTYAEFITDAEPLHAGLWLFPDRTPGKVRIGEGY